MCKVLIWFLLLSFISSTVHSTGVCPGSEIACGGSCNTNLPNIVTHSQALTECKVRNKRVFTGSRDNREAEASCSHVFNRNTVIWSGYKLRDGLVITEDGTTIDSLNWGLEYCGAVDQLSNFMVQGCSWLKRAICVSRNMQYDKNNLHECGGEYYWLTENTALNTQEAISYCIRNNMVLTTPYTATRKECLTNVLQRSDESSAWIDYNVTSATQGISPWDKDYCIKVNNQNQFLVDICDTKLSVTCASYGRLEATDVVIQKGRPAVLSCKCYDCSVNDVSWTNGMTVWRNGDSTGDVTVTSVSDTDGVRSTLTLTETVLDQVYTCTQNVPYTSSVIYRSVKVDVYNLEVTSHYVFWGNQILITCSFNNDKRIEIDRVEWSDRRDNSDLSGRARVSYRDTTVISTLEILAEYYTHDVRCTFHTRDSAGGTTAYWGVSRIIVYKIEGTDRSVPASENTTLTCDLKEHEGRSVDLVPPTRVDWVHGEYVIGSEGANPYRAVLVRTMRTGVDRYSCKFLFENGDSLSKTIRVSAFDYEGVPDVVANGTTATLLCKYSRGPAPQQPLWWEREGIRVNNNKKYLQETYQITSNFANDSFYIATTTLTVHNASYPALFQCGIKVSGKVWRKDIPLTVYLGEFIAPNVTITERVDPNTGQVLVRCDVWANPRPNVQLFVDNQDKAGTNSYKNNRTSIEAALDQTCDRPQLKCQASNNMGTRQRVIKSKLNKKCGFFQSLSLKMWLIIGGAVLLLIIIIIVVCCCFCRKTKKLKDEVQYQREVLSQVDGASTLHFSQIGPKVKNPSQQFEDMYSENGRNNYTGPGYTELPSTAAGYPDYNPSPYPDTGLMSPKYQRIESDYEASGPLFTARSKSRDHMARSRDNVFSPPLSKKSANSLSYQNLQKEQTPAEYPRKFSQPTAKLNPFGNMSRLQSDNDEIISITSRTIAPSEISGAGGGPPVAVLSPRGWEIPEDPARILSPPSSGRMFSPGGMFSPITAKRHNQDPMSAHDKVASWNAPPLSDEDGYMYPNTAPASSTAPSSATLDTISITPTHLAHKPVSLPKARYHPADRVARCTSPTSILHYAPPSSITPSHSASQYQPSNMSVISKRQHNLDNGILDLDDLSSVDVPDNGMDTLDRRVQKINPPAENIYTPSRGETESHVSTRTTGI